MHGFLKYIAIPAFLFAGNVLLSQVPAAYYNSSRFYLPGSGPFLETSLTIVGRSLAAREVKGGKQNSVNVKLEAWGDTGVVRYGNYNLLGPVFAGSVAPTFIDNQRYMLPAGNYTVKLTLTDNNSAAARPLLIREEVKVDLSEGQLGGSSVYPVESYSRATSLGPLTRSGYDLVPYNVNYYPESNNELSFYFEAYHVNTALGDAQPFVFTWYLEQAENANKLSSFGSFRKMQSAAVNPLLASMDISKLGTGNYNLVIELRDAGNGLRLQKKYFFQRLNRRVDIVALQKMDELRTVAEYFGRCNNADTLQMFVECLWPIANGLDKERVINHSVKKDPELMKKFVIDFWERRAADTANPLKMWGEYYQRVQQAMVLFKCGKQKGYYTERGRVFLQYGPPNQRAQQLNEPNTFPYEIWQYYRITDGVNGQFYTNRKFVFVNKNLGDDCFTLVHSDMRGEINNPRWAFEVSRRNMQGIGNPDQNTPLGTDLNQFNDFYSNPR
jgi:GWxTD domain-containing protein